MQIWSHKLRQSAESKHKWNVGWQTHTCNRHSTLLQSLGRKAFGVAATAIFVWLQARVEVGVLQLLNGRADVGDGHHIVRMRDFFVFRAHLCLVFELLSVNLYELVKHNQFRGLSMNLLRLFMTQVGAVSASLLPDLPPARPSLLSGTLAWGTLAHLLFDA